MIRARSVAVVESPPSRVCWRWQKLLVLEQKKNVAQLDKLCRTVDRQWCRQLQVTLTAKEEGPEMGCGDGLGGRIPHMIFLTNCHLVSLFHSLPLHHLLIFSSLIFFLVGSLHAHRPETGCEYQLPGCDSDWEVICRWQACFGILWVVTLWRRCLQTLYIHGGFCVSWLLSLVIRQPLTVWGLPVLQMVLLTA